MTIKIIPNDKGNPPGKLADAEIHFTSGPLDGLKLIGFGVWERRTGSRNVTFPARHSVNGERRSFDGRCSAIQCGSFSHPAAVSLGTTNLRQVSASLSIHCCGARGCQPHRTGSLMWDCSKS
jgi:hypothetical protein